MGYNDHCDYDYEDDARYEARMDARDEYAEEKSHTYKYNCGGLSNYSGPCGASDCGSCRNGAPPWEEEDEEDEEQKNVSSVKLVIARKARGSILPGDCVRVTSGFTYIEDGPRTGYYRSEALVGFGPGHIGDPVFGSLVGQGTWPKGREYKP
jgi:hypothetical protein